MLEKRVYLTTPIKTGRKMQLFSELPKKTDKKERDLTIQQCCRRKKKNITFSTTYFILLFCLAGSHALACDTLEGFEPGVSDYEFFLSAGGLGKTDGEQKIKAESLLGIGITDRLSGLFYVAGEGNMAYSEGTGQFGFGLFSTPWDTNHFDCDIGLNATIAGLGGGERHPLGHAQAEFTLTPFFELNLDSAPDMSGFGFYLVVEEVLSGRDDSTLDNMDREIRRFTLTPSTALTIGGYCSIQTNHQAYICFDLSCNHRNNKTEDEGKTEIGGIALGYNGMLSEKVELITEVNFDIPQNDEDFGIDFSIGFIAALPSTTH